MPITRREPLMCPEPPGRPADMTFESLAERLREGPFRTLLTLHVRAGTLAPVATIDDLERLEKLVELAQLARMARAQLERLHARASEPDRPSGGRERQAAVTRG